MSVKHDQQNIVRMTLRTIGSENQPAFIALARAVKRGDTISARDKDVLKSYGVLDGKGNIHQRFVDVINAASNEQLFGALS